MRKDVATIAAKLGRSEKAVSARAAAGRQRLIAEKAAGGMKELNRAFKTARLPILPCDTMIS
jgi:hypothetical protein